MASYSLRFKRSVAKDFRAFTKQDVAGILKRIESLAVDPRGPGCEKLSGQERYRLRQGIYRILYDYVTMNCS